MSKNKRMIYIWDENLEYFNQLPNKSDFINRQIAHERAGDLGEADFRKEEKTGWDVDQNAQVQLEGIDDTSHPDWHPDPNIRDLRKQHLEMKLRDEEAVRKSRL